MEWSIQPKTTIILHLILCLWTTPPRERTSPALLYSKKNISTTNHDGRTKTYFPTTIASTSFFDKCLRLRSSSSWVYCPFFDSPHTHYYQSRRPHQKLISQPRSHQHRFSINSFDYLLHHEGSITHFSIHHTHTHTHTHTLLTTLNHAYSHRGLHASICLG